MDEPAIPQHDPQLLRGVLSMVLLRLLAERESYGYELVVRVHDAGLTGVAEGTVYPALARLERERKVSSRLVPSQSGPARKYYQPTPAGYQALDAAEAAWNRLHTVVTVLLARPMPRRPVQPEADLEGSRAEHAAPR
jgi:PadR family transcriptional regulator PadR